jgi:plasmid stabilization system protein ParE
VAEEIDDTILRIQENPKLAPVVYKKDVRAVTAGRYDYRIFYTIGKDRIIIRNVRSTKRRRPWEL